MPLVSIGLERLHGLRGKGGWNRSRWWYSIAHVRQRCRNLSLSRVCTMTLPGYLPSADMLAYSPPLPFIIDHLCGYF